MSKFSEKCKSILSENGTNVYRLSKHSSLEHTTLQRMVTGKRLPNIEFVKSFCKELRMPYTEEKELLTLYKIEEIGEGTYRNRQCILDMINNLARLESNRFIEFNYVKPTSVPSLKEIHVSQQTYETELLLYAVLQEEFLSESPSHIMTNIPLTENTLTSSLMLLYHSLHKKVTVEHLTAFQIHSDAASINLKILGSVLPLVLSETLDYQVFYTYSKFQEAVNPVNLFPYYIITDAHVLVLSANMQDAILYSEPEVLALYRKNFHEVKLLAHPLLQIYDNPVEALQSYNSILSVSPSMISTLEYAPCIIDLMSTDNLLAVGSKCSPDIQPLVPVVVNSVYFGNNVPCIASYYTFAGLDTFCKTGRTLGNMGIFLPPASVSDRIRYLKHSLSSGHQDSHMSQYLLTEELRIPSTFYIESVDKNCLRLIKLESDCHIYFIAITESSICEAFHDFMTALPDSDYVMNRKDMDSLIQQKINELEKAHPTL